MSKDNGHDPLTVEMVEILSKIHGEFVKLQGLHTAVAATNAHLEAFQAEVRDELGELRAEVTSVKNEVRSLRGELHANLEEHRHSYDTRLRALEEAVFKRAS